MADIKPYPSPVFVTDYDKLAQAKIKAAYLMHATDPNLPGRALNLKLHSAWLFETQDNRVLFFRGGPETEPQAKYFGDIAKPSMKSAFGLGAVESTYDFGRIKAVTSELAEVAARRNPKRSPEEDAQTQTLDTVNFHEVVQGKGIGGLKPRPNVTIAPIETNPAKAQVLFNAALDVNKMLDKAQFAYSLLPQADGRTGINSHTVTAIAAERADQMTRASGWATNYLGAYANQGNLFVGASTAKLGFKGPDLNTVENLTNTQKDGNSQFGRWVPDNHKQKIPYAQLMPYSQGPQ